MSRRKSQEELDAEIEANEQRQAEIYRRRAECSHYRCQVAEWHWSGQPRLMRCDECGEENYLEESV
ncbi:hypothetical protein D3C77_49040 [compost metagenome]